jgi:hypothetical protein
LPLSSPFVSHIKEIKILRSSLMMRRVSFPLPFLTPLSHSPFILTQTKSAFPPRDRVFDLPGGALRWSNRSHNTLLCDSALFPFPRCCALHTVPRHHKRGCWAGFLPSPSPHWRFLPPSLSHCVLSLCLTRSHVTFCPPLPPFFSFCTSALSPRAIKVFAQSLSSKATAAISPHNCFDRTPLHSSKGYAHPFAP